MSFPTEPELTPDEALANCQEPDMTTEQQLTAARARIAELEAQVAEADRRAGRIARESERVRRELDDMKEAESRRESWRRSIKARWGVSDRVSLDDVFEEALQNKSALLATQRALVWAMQTREVSLSAPLDERSLADIYCAASAAVAQADGKEAL